MKTSLDPGQDDLVEPLEEIYRDALDDQLFQLRISIQSLYHLDEWFPRVSGESRLDLTGHQQIADVTERLYHVDALMTRQITAESTQSMRLFQPVRRLRTAFEHHSLADRLDISLDVYGEFEPFVQKQPIYKLSHHPSAALFTSRRQPHAAPTLHHGAQVEPVPQALVEHLNEQSVRQRYTRYSLWAIVLALTLLIATLALGEIRIQQPMPEIMVMASVMFLFIARALPERRFDSLTSGRVGDA